MFSLWKGFYLSLFLRAILTSFFMVRVGSLIDQSLIDDNQKDGKTKMRPSEQLSAIYAR